MKLTIIGLLVGAVAVACAAPRDPELEKAVHLVRQARSKPPDNNPSTAPRVGGAAMSNRPIKSYSGREIASILGAIEGQGEEIVATFQTAKGEIRCVLDERAPQTMVNFVGLASGQLEWQPGPSDPARKVPFYDGLTFHRIVNNFVIQTGNPTGRANAGPGWRLDREQGANDLFLTPGAMGMIDDSGATHGSQLFITAKRDRGLKNTYSAFGKCEPVALIQEISAAPKKEGSDGKAPADPVEIKKIEFSRR